MEFPFPKVKNLFFVLLFVIPFSETISSDSVVIPDIHWRDTKCEGETNLNNFEGSGPRRYHRCVNINGQMILSSKICAKGLVYDKTIKKCVNVPGNGYALYIDYEPHCPNNYNGLLKHPTQFQYYYICRNSSTIVAKCGHLQLFDNTNKRCQPLPLSALCTIKIYDASQGTLEVPDCHSSGRFSLPNECAFYYICISNLNIYYQYIHKCPGRTKYDPVKKYCTYNAKCEKPPTTTPSWVFLEDPYPPCTSHGRFRSPTDCSLYYTCSVKTNGTFYQERFECPTGTIFSNSHKFCVSDQVENCTLPQPFRKWPFLITSTVNSLENKQTQNTIKYSEITHSHEGTRKKNHSNVTIGLSTRKNTRLTTDKFDKTNGITTDKVGSTIIKSWKDRDHSIYESTKHHTTSLEKHHTSQTTHNRKRTSHHTASQSTTIHHSSIKKDKYRNEIIPLAVTSNDDATSSRRTHTRSKGTRTPHKTRIVTDKYGSTRVVTSPEDTDDTVADAPHKPGTGHRTHKPRTYTSISGNKPHGSRHTRLPHSTRIITDKYGSSKVVTSPEDSDDSGYDSPHKPGSNHRTHVPRNHTSSVDDKPHGSRHTRTPHSSRIITDKYGSTKVVTVPGNSDDSGNDSPQKPESSHRTHVPRNHTPISGNKPHGSRHTRTPHGTRIITDKYGSTKVVTVPEDSDDSGNDSPGKTGSGHRTHVPSNHSSISGNKPHGSKRTRIPHRTRIITDKYGSTQVVTSPEDSDDSGKETPHKPGSSHRTHVPRNHSSISGDKTHGSRHTRTSHGTRIITDRYGSTQVVTIPGNSDDSSKEAPHKPGSSHRTHVPRNHTSIGGDKSHGSRHTRTPHRTRIITDKYKSTKVVTSPGDSEDSGKETPHKPGSSHRTHVPRNHTSINGDKPHGSKRTRTPHGTRIITDKYGSTKIVTSPGDSDDSGKETPQKPGSSHRTHVPRNHSSIGGDKPHGSRHTRTPHGTRIITDNYGSTKVVTSPEDTDDSVKETPHKPGSSHRTHLPRNHTSVGSDKPHGSRHTRTPHGTRIITDKYGSTKVVTSPGDSDDYSNDSPHKPGSSHRTHVPRNHTSINGDKPHGRKRTRTPHRTRILTDKYGSTKVVTSPGDSDDSGKETPHKPGTSHRTHLPRNHTSINGDKPHGSRHTRTPHRTRKITDKYGSTKVVTSPGDSDDSGKETPHKPGSSHRTRVPGNHTSINGDKPHGSRHTRTPHGTRIITDKYGSTKVVTSPEDSDDSGKETPHKPGSSHRTHVPRNHSSISGNKPHGSKRTRIPHRTRIITDKYGSTKVVTIPGNSGDSSNDSKTKPESSHRTHVPRNHTSINGDKPHESKRTRPPHGTRIITDKYGSTKVVTSPGDSDDSGKETQHKPGSSDRTHVPRNHTSIGGDKPHGSRHTRPPHGTRILTDKYGSTKVVTSPGDSDDSGKETPHKPGAGHKTHVPRNHTSISGDKPHGSGHTRTPHGTRIITDKYGSTKVVTIPGDSDDSGKETPHKPGSSHRTHVPRNHTSIGGVKPHGSRHTRTPHGTRIITDKYGSTKVVTIPGDSDDSGKETPHKPGSSHRTHVPRNHTSIGGVKPHGSRHTRTPHGTRIITDKYGSTKVVTSPGDSDDSDKETPHKPGSSHRTHVPRNHTSIGGVKPHGSRHTRTPHGTRIITDKYGSTKVVTSPGDSDDSDKETPHKPGSSHRTRVPRNHTSIGGDKPHGSRHTRTPHGTRIITDKYGSTKVVTSPGDSDDSDKETPYKPGSSHRTRVPRNHTSIGGDKPHGSRHTKTPQGTRIITDKYGSTKIVTNPGDSNDSGKETPHKPGSSHRTHLPRNYTSISRDKPHGSRHTRTPHGTRIITDKYGSTKVVTSPEDSDDSGKETPHKPRSSHRTHVPRNHSSISGNKPHGSKRTSFPHRTRIITDTYGSTKVVTIPGNSDDSSNDSPPKPGSSHRTRVPRNHTSIGGDKPHGSRHTRTPQGTRIITDKYGSTKVVTSLGDSDDSGKETPHKPGAGHKTHVPRNHTSIGGDKPHGSRHTRTPHGTRIITDKYGSTKVVTNPGDSDDSGKETPHKPGTGHKTHVARNHTSINGDKPHGSKRTRIPHGTRIITDKYGSTKVVTSPGDSDDSDKETPHKPGSSHRTHLPRNHTSIGGVKVHGSRHTRTPHRTRIITDKYGSTKVVTIPGDSDDSDKETPHKPGSSHRTHLPRNHTSISGDKPHGSRHTRTPHGTRIITDKYGSTKVVTSPGDSDDSGKETPHKPRSSHRTHVPRNHSSISGNKPHESKRTSFPHRTRIITDKYGSKKVVTIPGNSDDSSNDSPPKPGSSHRTRVPRNHTSIGGDKPHGSRHTRTPHGTRIITDKYGSTKVVTSPGDSDDNGKETPHKPGTGHKTHVPRNHTSINGDKPHGSKRTRIPHGTRIITDKYGSTKVVTSPGDSDDSDKETPHKPGSSHRTHLPRNHTSIGGVKPHGSRHTRTPHRTRIITDKYGSTKVVTSLGDSDDSGKETPHKPGAGHKTHVPRNHTSIGGDKPHGSRHTRTPHGTRIITDKYGSTKVVTSPGDSDDSGKETPHKPGTGHKTHVPRNHTSINGDKPHGSKRTRIPHGTRIITDKYGSTKVVTSPGDSDDSDKETPHNPGSSHRTHLPRNHTSIGGVKPHGSRHTRTPHGTRIITDKYGSTKVVTIPGDSDDSDKETPHKPGSSHRTHLPRNHTSIGGVKPHGSRHTRTPHGTRIITDKYGSTKVVTSPGDADDSDKETPHKPGSSHRTHLPRNHTSIGGVKPHGSRHTRTPHRTRIITDKYGSTKVVTSPGDLDDSDKETPHKPGSSHRTRVPRNHTSISGDKPHGSRHTRFPHGTRIITDKYGSTKVVTIPGDSDDSDKETPHKPGSSHRTHLPRNHTSIGGVKPHGSRHTRTPHRTRIITDKYGSTKVVTSPGDSDDSDNETPHKPGSSHRTHLPRNHTSIGGVKPHGSRHTRTPHGTRIITDKYGSTKVVTIPGDSDDSDKETPHKPGSSHRTHLPRNHTSIGGVKPHGSRHTRTPHGTRIITDKYGSTKVVTSPGDADDSDKETPHKPGSSHRTHLPRNHTSIGGVKPHGSRHTRTPHGKRIITDKYGSTKVVTSPGDSDDSDKETPHKPGSSHRTRVPRNHTSISGDKPHGSRHTRFPHGTRIITDKYGSTKVVTIPGDSDDSDKETPHKPGSSHRTHLPRNHTSIGGVKPHGSRHTRTPHGKRIITDKYGSTKVVTSPGDSDDSDKETPHKPGSSHRTRVPRNHTSISGDKPHGSRHTRFPHGTRIITDKYGSTKVVTIPGDSDDSDKETPHKPGSSHRTHLPRNHTSIGGVKPHGSRHTRTPHGTRIITDKYGSTKVVTSPGDSDDSDKETPHKPGSSHRTHLPRNHTSIGGVKPHGSRHTRTPHGTRIITDKYGSTKVVTSPGDSDDSDKETPHKPGSSHRTHLPRNHTSIGGVKPHGSRHTRTPHRTRIITDKYGSTKVVTSPGDSDDSDKEIPHKPGSSLRTRVPRNHTSISGDKPHGSRHTRFPHGTRIITDKYGSTKVVTSPGDSDDSGKETSHKPGSSHRTHVPRNHTSIFGVKPHGSRHTRTPHGTRIITDKYGSTKVVTSPGDSDDSDKETPHKPGSSHRTRVPRNHTSIGGVKPHGSRHTRTPHGTRIITDKYGSTKVVTSPGDSDDSDKETPHKPGSSHRTRVPRNHTSIGGDKPHGSRHTRTPQGTRIITDKYGSTKVVTNPGDSDDSGKETPHKPGAGHKTHEPRNHTSISGDKPHGSGHTRTPHGTRIITDKYGSTKVVTIPGDSDDSGKETPHKPGSSHRTHLPRNHTSIGGVKPHGSRHTRTPHRTRIITDKYGSTKVVTSPGDSDDSDKETPHNPGSSHRTHLPRNHTSIGGVKPHGSRHTRTPHGTRIITDKYGSTKVATIPGDSDDSDKETPHKPGSSHRTRVPRNHTSISGDKPHGSRHTRFPHGTRIITDKYGSTKVVTIPENSDDSGNDSPHKPGSSHKTRVPRNHTSISGDKPHGSKRTRTSHSTKIITDKYGSTKVVTIPGDSDDSGNDSPHKPGSGHRTREPRNYTSISGDKPQGSKHARTPHSTMIITDKYGRTKVVTSLGDTNETDKDTSHKPGSGHSTYVPRNHTSISHNKPHVSKQTRTPYATNLITDKYGITTHAVGIHQTSIVHGTRITTTGGVDNVKSQSLSQVPTEKHSDHTVIKESYGTSKIPEISNQKRIVKDTQPPRLGQSTPDHSTHSVKTRRTPSAKNHSEHGEGHARSTHTRGGHTRSTHQEKTHKDVTRHTRNSTGTVSTKIHQTRKSRVTKVVQITQVTDKDHQIVTHPRNRTHQGHKNHTTRAGNHTLAPHTHRTHDYSNATVKDVQLDNSTKIGFTIKIKSYTFLNYDKNVTDIDGKHGGFTESPNCTRSGTFLYSKDCKKYFLCKVGKTTLFDFEIYECKEGLIYSQRYKICVSLNFETCTFQVFVPHFKPPTTPLPSSKQKVKCKDPGIFAFNDSCKSYYVCEKTNNKSLEANVQQCPPNTNFDIQYKRCLPEKVSKCNRFDSEIIQPTKTYTNNKELLKTTSTSIKNTEISVTEVSPKVPKNNTDECPESDNDCPHVGAFRVENSCHEYFECTYDRKCDRLVKTDTLVCPKCLRFNPVVGLCDYPHNVPECAPKMPDKYNCTGPGTFKVAKNCTQYAVCEKTSSGTYKGIRKHCPQSQNFNPSTLQCEENFECFVKKPECTRPGFFVNEHTCELYYQCVELDDDGNFDVVEHECPPNLLFDVEKQYCDFPDKVKGCQIEHHTLKPPLLPKPK